MIWLIAIVYVLLSFSFALHAWNKAKEAEGKISPRTRVLWRDAITAFILWPLVVVIMFLIIICVGFLQIVNMLFDVRNFG